MDFFEKRQPFTWNFNWFTWCQVSLVTRYLISSKSEIISSTWIFSQKPNPKNLTLNRRTPSNMKVIPDLFLIQWTWCTRRLFYIQENQTGGGTSLNRGSSREWHLYKVYLQFERVRQGFRPSHIWVWFCCKTRRRRVDHVQWMQKSVGMTCMEEGVRLLGFRVKFFRV